MPGTRPATGSVAAQELAEATVRFAGDAGDGMLLVGSQFAAASARHGNYVCTLPENPAEIRAITGTLANAASFQVRFTITPHHTPGDQLHTLVAMNPAALRANVSDLEANGILIVNSDSFSADLLQKAGYPGNPLLDDSLGKYRLAAVPMHQLNHEAVTRVNLSAPEADRCRSFFPLGLVCWLYDRPLEPVLEWIRDRYVKNPAIVEANIRTLRAGYQYGESGHLPVRYQVAKASVAPGRYRSISGAEALTSGMLTLPQQTGRSLVFACFPMAPANELLHLMADRKQANVKVIQAEDDLAALQIAIGAAFGGAIGVTATTSIGLSLQSEALGLAVMSELPCVVLDIQRAGPSTGMPSKTEQADLLQALHGRHGECPLIVLAPATPADCFAIVHEAARLALHCMSPVVVLADNYLAQVAESWRVPSLRELPAIQMQFGAEALPYERDERLARPWHVPGTAGQEHRTGGLEKEDRTGNVSFDPVNHEAMVRVRAEKIARAADVIAPLVVQGDEHAELLVLGWGSTFGAIEAAVERSRRKGRLVAHAHLRHLHPMPKNTAEIVNRYRKILVPELNSGQLSQVLRANFGVTPIALTKVQGRPFTVAEIACRIDELLA